MPAKVEVFNSHPSRKASGRRCRILASEILKCEGWTERVDVGIVLCDDSSIRNLNRRFAHKDSPTDILAFPLSDDVDALEGELYISLDRAREQAEQYGVSFERELSRLIIHGLLHLLGYQDDNPQGRKEMHEREDFYLEKCASLAPRG